MFSNKSILLIIGGGIAAYKSLELVRALKAQSADVHVILTKAAQQFITPLSAAALSGNKVHTDLFDLTAESEMGHIALSRSADLIVVAPATANLMARHAMGMAADLAGTVLLATDTPVLVAPAMNVRMWEHPATQRNLAQLREDGVMVAGPNEGDMACGEYGYGRMAEPDEIISAIGNALAGKTEALKGCRVIITSGPTREPIDPVRYISNHSSGHQGAAIAGAMADRGAEVTFITGPAEVPPPGGLHQVKQIETAEDMLKAVMESLPADVMICAAAVADWRAADPKASKMKKNGKLPDCLQLALNPDILKTVSQLEHNQRPKLVIGFAAETENVLSQGAAKLQAKGCDWIVANDVSIPGVMGGTRNLVHLLTGQDTESWPEMSKTAVASRLADRIAGQLAEGGAD